MTTARKPKHPRRRGTGGLSWDIQKGSWRARTVPIGGKRTTKLFPPEKTTAAAVDAAERQAHEWLDGVVEKIRRGELTPTTSERAKLTLRAWASEWVAELNREVSAGDLARRTAQDYADDMRRYVLPYLGDVRLRNLTGPKVKAWLQDLRSTRSRLGNNLSDATVSRSYRTLHRCLRDAELGINPADDIKKKPRVDLHEQNFDRVTWEPDELDSFLGHVAQCDQSGGVRLFALWTVLARTGMRRGEGLGLRWSDIDLKREELSVRQTIGVDGHQLYLNNTPKGKRSRTIPFIEDDTPRLLSEWREIQALEKQYAGDRWDPDPQFGSNLVFTNEIGRPIHPSNMSKWFQQHVGHLGDQVRRTNLHGLRHAHGSHLIGAWLPLKVAADRLGHTVAVLESTYAHEIRALSDDSREEMRERYRKLSTSPPPV